MNIEGLNNYFKSITNESLAHIEENYKEIIKKATSKFNQNLLSITQKYAKDVKTSKMQEICENELVNQIINSRSKTINNINTHLNDLVYAIIRDVENGAEESNISDIIDHKMSFINRSISSTWINGYISDYLSSLKSFFCFSYESPFTNVSQVEKFYTDLQGELRRYLINEVNKIDSNMKDAIKKELDTLSSKYKNSIHEYRIKSNVQSNSDMKEFHPIVEMANLRLVNRGYQDYIVDPITNEFHQLEENGRTTDNRYIILSNKIGEFSIGDSVKNINIISDNSTIRIINKETNERIKIEYNFYGYEFTLNERKIEEPDERKEFIIMLYEKFPGIYKHLCEDPFLGKELEDAISQKQISNASMSIGNIKENTRRLLNELDKEETVSVTEQSNKSEDDELFELEQNPIVKRYLELKKKQEEQNMALPSIL